MLPAVTDTEQEARRQRRLLDAMSEAFCVLDVVVDDDTGRAVDFRYRDVNSAFVRHTGVSDVEGRLASEVFPDLEPVWFETMVRVRETGEPAYITEHVARLGRWFEVSVNRVGGKDARLLTCLFRDVTDAKLEQDERERTATRLRELAAALSEGDRHKNEFLATLAHELRNPLAPIRNGLDVMATHRAEDRDDPVEFDALRTMMSRQVDHVVRLVDDLLDVSRISRGTIVLQPELVALSDALAPAVEAARALMLEEGHAFEVELPDAAFVLRIDPVRIAQVAANLLDNAARYTPRGGHVRLKAGPDGDDALVTVTDDGDGLHPEGRTRIFEMFARDDARAPRRHGGLGVGLPLAERLARLHGGTLTAHSDGPGTGSRFELRIPLAVPAATGGTDGSDDRAGHPAGVRPIRRILVVDDNVDAAETLAKVLRLRGFETLTAHGGRAAIDAVREAAPDLVFLDLGMPDMTGFDVAARLDAEGTRAGLALVALTGWGAAEDRARTAAAGFDRHLTKPVSAAKVLAVIGDLGAVDRTG